MDSEFEKMDVFFNRRASDYDNHMQENVDDFKNFYKNIAADIEKTDQPIKILDIGCGTGIELEFIFKKVPYAKIMCLDMAEKMLDKLKEKYKTKTDQIEVQTTSYLEKDLGFNRYNYIISVMTAHHIKYDKKLKLYKNIYKALVAGGKYIEGDYIVSPSKEKNLLDEYDKRINNSKDNSDGKYHIDIPFSLETEKNLFKESGFKDFKLIYKKEESAIYSVTK